MAHVVGRTLIGGVVIGKKVEISKSLDTTVNGSSGSVCASNKWVG